MAALGFAFAGSAVAHPGPSYWTKAKAESALKRQGITWGDGSRSTIKTAHCVGKPPFVRRGGVKMFKHFTCHLRAVGEEPFTVRFHVLGTTRFSVVEVA
jgi:hypothetical protein